MLFIRLFRYTMLTCGLVMLAGAVFVGIRLVPLSLRHGVAWGTSWPLWASALATLFETALLLGTPLGFALTIAGASGHQTIQSAGNSATGVPPLRSRLGAAVLWLMVTSGIGAYAHLRIGAPGLVARGVVQGALEVCEASRGHRSEPVPIIGARWICSPSAPPLLVGELSKNGSVTQYSARALEVSEDLAYVDITGLDLSSPAVRGRPSLHLAVHGARLRGAWPWVKAKRMPGFGRAVYVASLGSLLGVLGVVFMSRRRTGLRFAGPLVAVVGGGSAWLLLGIVDSHANWSTGSYAMVPFGAALAMIVTWTLLGHRNLYRVIAASAAGWWRPPGMSQRKPH